MDGCASKSPFLSASQRQILQARVACRQSAQGLVVRAQIVLLADDGWGVLATARHLHVDVKTVRLWRRRWAAASSGWEQDSQDWDEKVWREKIEQALCDAPRSGAPCTFQPEHVCQIIAPPARIPGNWRFRSPTGRRPTCNARSSKRRSFPPSPPARSGVF